MSFLHFFKKSPKHSKRGRRPQPQPARLCLETLEERITPSVTLDNGSLIVNGEDNFGNFPNIIEIGVNSSGGVAVALNGQPSSFSAGQVSSIHVRPGNYTSDNEVFVRQTLAGVPVIITSSTSAQDHVSLGQTSILEGDLDLIKGPVTVNGNGNSFSDIEINDRLNPRNNTYTITKNSVNRDLFGGLNYSGVGTLFFVGTQSSNTINTINVNSTNLGTGYVLEGLSGVFQTIHLGTGNLDAIAGFVNIENSASNLVVLHDEANPLAHNYSITRTDDRLPNDLLMGRDGSNFIIASSSSAVTLNGGSAGNTYNMESGREVALTINAGAANDNFNVSPTSRNLDSLLLPLTLNGGGGTNALVVDDLQAPETESYELTSTSVLRVGLVPIHYSGMQVVDVWGGNHGNNFSILSGANLTIDAGLGNNTVTVGDPFTGLGAIHGLNVVGLDNTQLILDDHANTVTTSYLVRSSQVIRTLGLVQISYSGIDNLVLNSGKGGNEITVLDSLATTAATINAGPGGDNVHAGGSLVGDVSAIKGFLTVVGNSGNTRFTVFDQSTTTPQTFFVTDTTVMRNSFFVLYKELQSVTVNGGSGGNNFLVLVASATTLVTLNGGGGSNTLTGPAPASPVSWTIRGAGSGRIGERVIFTSMHDLVGADDKDLFQFTATGSIAGTVNGGGSDNELIYSAPAAPVTVNLQTRAAPQIHAGTAGGFSNILVFVGSGLPGDTLIGPAADTIWSISSGNGGFLSGSAFRFTYTRFGNLVGGPGLDVFRFVSLGSLAGSIDGGGAPLHQGNWLNYSELTTGVTVNLQTGAASGVAGGAAGKVANIQNVHGGAGANALTGNAQGNIVIGGADADTLTGGTGLSLLIGDAGADKIMGGSGGDILVGDATNFDPMTTGNEKALMSILAEWQSADSYETRFHDIDTGSGGGLNGTFRLNFGTTVKDDGAADTVTAAPTTAAVDWLFQGAGDSLSNVEPGEHINNNTPAAFKDRTVTSPIDEGGRATVSGTITDPDPHDTFTLEVNWGDGTPTQNHHFPPGSDGQRVSVSHRYRDSGTYTIQLSWHDPMGPANNGTLTVTVNNVAPTVDAGGDATLKHGQTFERKGSFTDPGADSWAATVDYGDGAGPQALELKGRHFTLHHKYREAGTYHVVVTVRDGDGDVSTAAFDIAVR